MSLRRVEATKQSQAKEIASPSARNDICGYLRKSASHISVFSVVNIVMRKSKPIVVFITTPAKEAKPIARALLNQKKVACVNIIPRVYSLFWWEGKIDSADEVILMIKTKSHLFDDIVKLVKKLHSYDVPEVIALPIIDGNKDYLRWINESVKN